MEEQKFPSRSERYKRKKKKETTNIECSEVSGLLDLKNESNSSERDGEDKKAQEDQRLQEILLNYQQGKEVIRTSAEESTHKNELALKKQKLRSGVTQKEFFWNTKEKRLEKTAAMQDVSKNINERKNKKKRHLRPTTICLMLLLLLFTGAWCGYAAVNAILPSPDSNWTGSQDQEMLDNINILVLGCDEREGDTAVRADVIMVATIRPEQKQVSVFSIPRDTRVAIAGHGKDKINHSMAYGGIPLIKSTVENLLDVQIDHTVKVNFDGFINVIDALGGINLDVPCRMYKPLEAIDLLPGYQTLSGAEALAFVRWRGDGTGDYGRIERQQQFLSAVTTKLKTMNIKQALGVVSAVMDSIETDMSVKQMTSYGMNLLGIGSDDIKTYSFVGKSLKINGVDYVEPDTMAIKEIVDKMQHGDSNAETVEENGTETEKEDVEVSQ